MVTPVIPVVHLPARREALAVVVGAQVVVVRTLDRDVAL